MAKGPSARERILDIEEGEDLKKITNDRKQWQEEVTTCGGRKEYFDNLFPAFSDQLPPHYEETVIEQIKNCTFPDVNDRAFTELDDEEFDEVWQTFSEEDREVDNEMYMDTFKAQMLEELQPIVYEDDYNGVEKEPSEEEFEKIRNRLQAHRDSLKAQGPPTKKARTEVQSHDVDQEK